MSLEITVDDTQAGTSKVALSGRLDTDTASELEERLEAELARAPQRLVMDLGELHYISSAGIRALLRARKMVTARNGHFLILNPQPQVKQVFRIVKAMPLQEIFTSSEDLDEYLDTIQQQVLDDRDDT